VTNPRIVFEKHAAATHVRRFGFVDIHPKDLPQTEARSLVNAYRYIHDVVATEAGQRVTTIVECVTSARSGPQT
jgi:hypothetical protein